MGSIVNNPFRVYTSDQFLQEHKERGRPLYVAISRSRRWDNALPPEISNTAAERSEFVRDILGMQKVKTEDLIPVIFKHVWEEGDEDFVEFDENSENAVYSKFYALNSEDRVYQCVKKGAGAVSSEPLGHNNGNVIATGDGYEWKYFYSLKDGERDKFATGWWMPIHFGDYSTTEQADHGSKYVNIAFGAHHVLVYAKLTDEGLPNDVTYHQIGLISGPRKKDGTYMDEDFPKLEDMDVEGFDVIHIENRYPVTRNIGKWEKVSTTIEF